MDYFNRSAHPVRADQAPFPMALHALGGHYQNQGRAYWKTAKDYYTKAAQAGLLYACMYACGAAIDMFVYFSRRIA